MSGILPFFLSSLFFQILRLKSLKKLMGDPVRVILQHVYGKASAAITEMYRRSDAFLDKSYGTVFVDLPEYVIKGPYLMVRASIET